MIRLLILLAAVALAGWGLMWLADNPGFVTLTWRGVEYQFSLMVALGVIAIVAVVWTIIWAVLRFISRAPGRVSLGSRARRRRKGLDAMSRGFIAVNTGDARAAVKHAADANRLVAHEPMAKLLKAQAAQLSGDRPGAIAAYSAMLDNHDTRALGLRGLHLEARRDGDHEAALQYAMQANANYPAPWAGQAVLEDRTRRTDWSGALATVDSNAAARLIDKPTAQRWRAVLKTAMAEEEKERDPNRAAQLAQEASRLAPGLVPAVALYGRLAAETGDYRKAGKALEAAYAQTPHPDLADAYLRLRRSDLPEERLARAQALARIAPNDPESMLTVGRAALEAHDMEAARKAIAPLLASETFGRPTRRVCLLMADIEEAGGHQGAVREWLSRAARAPRDKAWIADGVISDRWAPVSPSGTLDAFVWGTPDERLAPTAEPLPAPQAETIPPRPVEVVRKEEPKPALELSAAPASDPVASPAEGSVQNGQASPPRPGLVVDPESIAPDDPGPGEAPRRRRSWIYAND